MFMLWSSYITYKWNCDAWYKITFTLLVYCNSSAYFHEENFFSI